LEEKMIIDIDRVPREGLEISKDFEFFSVDLVNENAVFIQPVHAELTIKKAGEEILMKGKIVTCLNLICSRCLVPYEFPIDSKFDLVYFPEELEETKEQLDSDELHRLFYSSRKIDVTEIILEQLNMAFPVKPLCSGDCQGICPVCGKIIRDDGCACVREISDPRLEKLKTFKR
jgi:uncharacterized protein